MELGLIIVIEVDHLAEETFTLLEPSHQIAVAENAADRSLVGYEGPSKATGYTELKVLSLAEDHRSVVACKRTVVFQVIESHLVDIAFSKKRPLREIAVDDGIVDCLTFFPSKMRD